MIYNGPYGGPHHPTPFGAAGAVAAEAAEPESPPQWPVPPGRHVVGWFVRTGEREYGTAFVLDVGADGEAVVVETQPNRPPPPWLLDALGARLAD